MNRFELFARTVPPDTFQVKLITLDDDDDDLDVGGDVGGDGDDYDGDGGDDGDDDVGDDDVGDDDDDDLQRRSFQIPFRSL